MLILNTGGTFNKRYNPVSGELEVPYDNDAVEAATRHFGYELNIAGAIYKDSLDMTLDDRKMLADIINASEEEIIVIVHGTDTMDQSAAFIAETVENKAVIFTGAMIPFSIDPVDATANLSMALGFAASHPEAGAYIVIQGLIAPYDRIEKNKAQGRFEIV
jgi:L-asparaginase